MNILVINDDGFESAGIHALAAALSEIGDVYVCAPMTQSSGASQSLTIHGVIRVYEKEFPGVCGGLVVEGTPADCTKMGIQYFGAKGVTFDLLYSGVNKGSNLGKDTLYSGTVGAAMEGALYNIRSVAVSVDSHDAEDFSTACEVAVDVADFVLRETTPDTVLNINVPYLPKEEIKGIRTTRLGERYYDDVFEPDGEGGYYLNGAPKLFPDPEKIYDMTAVSEGYISITPLTFDYTQAEMLETVAKSGLEIRR